MAGSVNQFNAVARTDNAVSQFEKPEVIDEIFLRHRDMAPVRAAIDALHKLGRRKKLANKPNVTILHEGRMPTKLIVGTGGATATATSIPVVAAYGAKKHTSWYCPRTREQGTLSADPASATSTTITSLRGQSDDALKAPLVAGDTLVLMNVSLPENWEIGTGMDRVGEYHEDVFGFVTHDMFLTWHAAQRGYYGGKREARLNDRATYEFLAAMNRAAVLQKPFLDTSGNVGITNSMSAGIKFYGDKYNPVSLSGVLTQKVLDDKIQHMLDEGGPASTLRLYMTPELKRRFSQVILGIAGMVRQDFGDTSIFRKPVGKINSAVDGAPSIEIVPDWTFRNSAELKNTIIAVNWEHGLSLDHGERIKNIVPTGARPTGTADFGTGAIGYKYYDGWGLGVTEPLAFAATFNGVEAINN